MKHRVSFWTTIIVMVIIIFAFASIIALTSGIFFIKPPQIIKNSNISSLTKEELLTSDSEYAPGCSKTMAPGGCTGVHVIESAKLSEKIPCLTISVNNCNGGIFEVQNNCQEDVYIGGEKFSKSYFAFELIGVGGKLRTVETDGNFSNFLPERSVNMSTKIEVGNQEAIISYTKTGPLCGKNNNVPTGNRTILEIQSTGGLCPSDKPCGSVIKINYDGSYSYEDNNGKKINGTTSQEKINMLIDGIEKTDFAVIRSKSFTGTCPTAYDGQEVSYTFYTSLGKEIIGSCTYVIDYESLLFKTIQSIIYPVNRE